MSLDRARRASRAALYRWILLGLIWSAAYLLMLVECGAKP